MARLLPALLLGAFIIAAVSLATGSSVTSLHCEQARIAVAPAVHR